MLAGAITGTTTICYNTDVPAFGSTTPATGGDGTITYTWQYTTNMVAVPGDANWADIGASNSTTYDPGNLQQQPSLYGRLLMYLPPGCLLQRTYNHCTSGMLPGAVTGTTTICYNTNVPAFASTTPASGGDGTITYTWQYTTIWEQYRVMQTGPTSAHQIQQLMIRVNLTTTTKYVRKAVDGTCAVVVTQMNSL